MNKYDLYLLIYLLVMFSVIPITLLGIKYLGVETYVNILCVVGAIGAAFAIWSIIYSIIALRKMK